jgi:hypothetical protein
MTLRTLIGPLFAFLLVSLASPLHTLAAQAEPPWLTSLRAAKAEPIHVDRVTVPQPADSRLGYWTVTHEAVPAEIKTVPVRSIDTDAETPKTRTITTPAKIIHYWAWVEETVKYQGNTDSMTVHRLGCRYWDCRYCTDYFTTLEDALEEGYRPCRVCKPEEAAD